MIRILSADKFCLEDLTDEFFHKDQGSIIFSLDNLENIKNIFINSIWNTKNTLKRISTFNSKLFYFQNRISSN